jgi:peptidoglycan hydrolase-like protein with peptidoglycan-binding domain
MNTMILQLGDKGVNVRRLKGALVLQGFALTLEGPFDTDTRDAVEAFQEREGLEVDGIAGPITLTALGLRFLLIVLQRGDRGIDVLRIQEALDLEGFDIEIDGAFGRETEGVVKQYQKQEGLKVDGIVGENTLIALGVDVSEEPSKHYRIFPSIGIARIGKSDEMFIGPESPFKPVKGPFKKNGEIKKQGARFRIYEFEVDEFGREVVIQELTRSSSVTIKWHVHLCNRKAAAKKILQQRLGGTPSDRNPTYIQEKLVIEAEEELSGANKRSDDLVGKIQFIRKAAPNVLDGEDSVVLGRLETDNRGRLIVFGGNGVSKSPLNTREPLIDFANNAGWYDDLCDGPVRATITMEDQTIEAVSAWVVVGSPAYAPEIDNFVTWYDQAKNVVAEHFDVQLRDAIPSFTDDIYPILKRVSLVQWVSAKGMEGHTSGEGGDFLHPDFFTKLASVAASAKPTRQRIFDRLTAPGTEPTAAHPFTAKPGENPNMPVLNRGLNPADPSKYVYPALTALQYEMMRRWALGGFTADWNGEPPERALEDLPLAERPAALTRAALEDCIGGPFFPGIETTYIMALPETYEAPFRIDQTLPPGHMTEMMAVPWQADFKDCGKLWWPAQRPVCVRISSTTDEVKPFSRGIARGIPGFADMLQFWNELGFIVRDGDAFIEDERGTIPGSNRRNATDDCNPF